MSHAGDLRALNLNLLPALDALLRERQVSLAARRMGVSQSAMSHSLGKLRELFDDPLLVASGRGMMPTPRGERIAASLPNALSELSAILAPPEAFDPATTQRTFTIATLDYFEVTTLPEVLTYLEREAPGIELNIERFGAGSVDRLRAGEIDLVITGTSARVPAAGLRQRHLYDEGFAVIARRGHPTVKRRLTLETYVRLHHVLVSVDGRAEGIVDRTLREQGLTRRVSLRVPHFLSAPIAVSHSDLICTIASSVAERAKQMFGVNVLPPPLEIPPASVVAWWPRQDEEDPAGAWFRDLLFSGRALSPALRRLMRPA